MLYDCLILRIASHLTQFVLWSLKLVHDTKRTARWEWGCVVGHSIHSFGFMAHQIFKCLLLLVVPNINKWPILELEGLILGPIHRGFANLDFLGPNYNLYFSLFLAEKLVQVGYIHNPFLSWFCYSPNLHICVTKEKFNIQCTCSLSLFFQKWS